MPRPYGGRRVTPAWAYASGRQFWICSVGATRVEALTALADLWGWESRAIPGGRRLARVIPRTPPLPAELGASIRRALPPAVRHEARFTYVWMERRQPGRGLRALFDQLTRAEGVDSTIPLADLPAETQRILVAIVLMNVAQPWVANPTVEQRDPKGLPHLAEPRAIVLRGGPPSGEAPGMIRIAAPLDPSSPEAWPELGWRAFTIPWGGLAFYTEVPQPDGSTRFEKSEVPESVRDEMRERMAHYAP